MFKRKLLFLLILLALLLGIPAAIFAAGSTERPQSLRDGLHVTGATSDRWSFGGATPAAQSATTKTAWQSLVDHGVIATGQDYSVRHATVSLTAANLIAMYAAPVALLPAPGSGKSIVVTRVAFTITRTATAFTGGGAAIIQYGTTVNGGGTQALDSTLAATVVTGAAGTTVSCRNGAVISDLAAATIQNAGVYISNATAAFAAGTGTATVDIWYVVY